MWNEMIVLFKNYIGNGQAAGLFLASFIYLMVAEKDRIKRIILLYVSAVTIALFFLPFFAQAIYRYLDKEIYYRILWLVPMTMVISYAGIRLVAGFSKKWIRVLVSLMLCGMIMLTGDYVYDNPYFDRAVNRFHVPGSVALVCDAIIVEGREVRAVFPDEMLPYVRQYTANVCMPYGREMVVERWQHDNPLYDAMTEDELDCKEIASLAAEQECHYIILHEATHKQEEFKNTGYHYVETVAGYCIYLKDDAYLGLKYEENYSKE